MSEGHEGHRSRLKEQFLKAGLDSLPPHNALELLLFYSVPRKDTNELARRLLSTYGTLGAVLDAPADDLIRVEGVSSHTAVHLKLISSFARLYYKEKAEMDTPENTMERLGKRLVAECVGRTEETAYLICFDSKMKELYFGIIGQGSADAVSIRFRKIAEIALRLNASTVVLAHNHPHGLALPSKADVANTLEYSRLLEAISVKLVDHIVVAGGDFVSMAQSGILSEGMYPERRTNRRI